MMPNMTVLAPKNDRELEEMLAFAVSFDGPIAIRYPRGSAHQGSGISGTCGIWQK